MRKLLAILIILLLLLPVMGCDDLTGPTSPPSNPAGPVEPTIPESPEEPGDTTPPVPINYTFEAHFIDVGQGDAIYLKFPIHNILIDGGPRNSNVVQYLKEQGVTELDLVVATHPHADHIAGLIDVFKAFPVKEALDPAVPHTTKTFEEYLNTIDELDIKFTEARAGMKYHLVTPALTFCIRTKRKSIRSTMYLLSSKLLTARRDSFLPAALKKK